MALVRLGGDWDRENLRFNSRSADMGRRARLELMQNGPLKTLPASKNMVRHFVFDVYGGPFCAWCDEADMDALTLDHVNDDGAFFRKFGRHKTYTDYINENFPKYLQPLCASCNQTKQTRGVLNPARRAAVKSGMTYCFWGDRVVCKPHGDAGKQFILLPADGVAYTDTVARGYLRIFADFVRLEKGWSRLNRCPLFFDRQSVIGLAINILFDSSIFSTRLPQTKLLMTVKERLSSAMKDALILDKFEHVDRCMDLLEIDKMHPEIKLLK